MIVRTLILVTTVMAMMEDSAGSGWIAAMAMDMVMVVGGDASVGSSDGGS